MNHPSSRNRHRRQKLRAGYAKMREAAQLHGIIETRPEGAVRPERVRPDSQAESPQVFRIRKLIMQAIEEGWATTEEGKRKAVAWLEAVLARDDVPPATVVTAIRTMQQLDRDEWERRNPELAGKVKGGGVTVSQTQQVITGDQMIRALQEIEKATGQPIMSEAMLAIEQDASAVLPDEIT